MKDREELRRVAREWLELWNAPVDWEAFDRLHADDFVDEASAGRPATRQGFAEGLARFVRAFPDARATVEDLVADETTGRVAVRWRITGTNRERYLDVGPTHRATVITGIEIVEIRAGRVVRRWGEWDVTAHRDDAP